MNILNYKDEISIFANLITILAFGLAIIAFLNWKKEQKNSKKLDYLMELEDQFVILLHSIKEEYKFFSTMEKCLIDFDKKSQEKKKNLNDYMIDAHEKYKLEETLINNYSKYSLSLVRVKRFLKDIDKDCKSLDYYFLQKLNKKAITLAPKWNDKNNISDEAKEFLGEIRKIEKEVIEYLQKVNK